MMRVEIVVAPDELHLVAATHPKQERAHVVAIANKDITIIIKRRIGGDRLEALGQVLRVAAPLLEGPGDLARLRIDPVNTLARHANDPVNAPVHDQEGRDVSTVLAQRLALPDGLARLGVKGDDRRLVASRRVEHLIIKHERTFGSAPLAGHALEPRAAIDPPDLLAVGRIEADDLARATDDVGLPILYRRRSACLRVGIGPRFPIVGLVKHPPIQREGIEDLPRLVLVHAGDVEAVADDHRAGVALTDLQRLPKHLRALLRPLLQ